MNLPKISVIIPYYNVPESLTKKSIDSVLQQTYPNIEIIIVNDGSENLNIFTEYQKKYNNIKVVEHKTNKGLFQARITGIKACHGDYIAFLDSDDSVSMDFYRKLLRTIQKNDADICIADYVYEYEDGSKKYFPSQELRNIDISYSNKEILDKFISGHGYDFAWQVVWNKLYKRSVIEQALPYLEDFAKTSGHLIMAEDIAYTLSFYLFANKTVNCHNVYYYYYALGIELFAVVTWIIENAQNRGRIHFVARDGYLPQRAYEIIKKELNLNLPESNYLYSSRKFLYPLSLGNKMDLFTSPQQINICAHNIDKLMSYFPEECINREEYSKIPNSDRKRKFANCNDFYDHINQIASLINFEKLNEYRDEVKNYLSAIIRDNDIIFDIGYNGRTEAILSRLLGFSVNSLILHHYSDVIYQNKNKLGFCNKCFFDYRPKVTGELREMLLMKTDRSFLRFDFKKNGVVENVFCSTVDFNDSNVSIINAIQNNALQFIIDLLKNNGNYLNILQMYSKDVACLPLENYLMRPESIDQLIWKSFDFEDDIGQGIINVIQSWNRQLEYNNLLFVNQTANNVKLSLKKRFINKLFPYGTKRRKRAVKFVNTLLPKGTKRRRFVKALLRWK